jgi:hypothetical protein
MMCLERSGETVVFPENSIGLLEVAPEHEGGAVTVRLAEFVARRDVGHTFAETEVLEPTLDNEDVESSLGEIGAEHEAVMAGTNDDAIVVAFESVHGAPRPRGRAPRGEKKQSPA